jgi:hypothetical protein
MAAIVHRPPRIRDSPFVCEPIHLVYVSATIASGPFVASGFAENASAETDRVIGTSVPSLP